MSSYQLDDSLGYIISLAGRAITNEVQRKFREFGCDVTTEHWVILVQLWNKDGLTQNELACLTGKDEPSVSRLIQNMLNRQLIYRETDPNDGRRRIIYLTEKGLKLQQALMALVEESYVLATQDLSLEEVALTKKILRKITANLTVE